MLVVASAVVLGATTLAHAAPWSFELPAGYTEQPAEGAADVAALRARKQTVSVDAQVYMSPDNTVMLRRLTWKTRMDGPLSREVLVAFDHESVGDPDPNGQHISDDRKWIGDQLVADTIDELRGKRLHQRRLYSADSSGVVYVMAVTCLGPAEQLGDCEQAQQSMQLTLPDAATLPEKAAPKRKRETGVGTVALIGGAAFVALVIGLIAWVIQSARRGGRRRRTR
jgi:hypothetical protein